MIHFIDQTSEGNHHMVYNASIIKILLHLYPNQPITIHGLESSHHAMKELLGDTGKDQLNFYIIQYTKPLGQQLPLKALNYIKKEKTRKQHFKSVLEGCADTDFIFLSITTFTSFYQFKKLKQHYKVPTVVTLHGDIDFIYHAQSRLEKWNSKVHKKIFQLQAPNFKYLLLNKIAKPFLVRDGYLKDSELYEIEHPYTGLPQQQEEFIPDQEPVVMAHIGSMEVSRKQSHFIYELADHFKKEIEEGKLVFQTIGLITPSVVPYKNKWVTEIVGNEHPENPKYLSRKSYEAALTKVHYTLFFYPEMEYVFRASGATVDTIEFGKPILTLQHPYFNHVAKVVGPVGYSCQNIMEMKTRIQDLLSEKNERIAAYQEFQQHLAQFKDAIQIPAVAQDLEQQWSTFVPFKP
jgi:hypothetical protein